MDTEPTLSVYSEEDCVKWYDAIQKQLADDKAQWPDEEPELFDAINDNTPEEV